jgi:peptide deformylase
MVLPILSYGNQKLNRVCKSVGENDPELQELIDNMWETLDASNGAGLAAPQVDKSLQLFIIDSDSTFRVMSEFERKNSFNLFYFGIEGNGILIFLTLQQLF